MAFTQSDSATGSRNYNSLVQLISKYGYKVSKVPPAQLAAIGYNPQTAMSEITANTGRPADSDGAVIILGMQLAQSRQSDSGNAAIPTNNSNQAQVIRGMNQVYSNNAANQAPRGTNPAAGFQDSDKANRARIMPTPIDTGRGLDSWDRGSGIGNKVADSGLGGDFGTYENIPMPGAAGMPPPPPAFDFKMNDFSGKANKMAENAYSPQFEAVQLAKDNVVKNYDTNRQILSGLFQGLSDTINANKQDVANRYATAQSNTANQYNNLGQGIQDTYSNSQNQMADLLMKLGAGSEAASSVLPQGAGDQAYYQNQAAQQGASAQDYLTQTGNAAQDYQTNIGTAAATQGVVSQQDLMRSKDNALTNWDYQNLNLKGNEAQQALQLAQQMSDRDMQLQQLNYGAGQDAWQNAFNVGQFNAGQAQQNYQNRVGQANTSWAQQMDQANLGLKQLGMDRDWDIQNRTLDIQSKPQGAPKANNPFTEFDNQLIQVFGDNPVGGDVKSLIAGFVNKRNGNLATYGGDGLRFANDVAMDAANSGVDPEAARQAAIMYWKTVYSGVAPKMQ